MVAFLPTYHNLRSLSTSSVGSARSRISPQRQCTLFMPLFRMRVTRLNLSSSYAEPCRGARRIDFDLIRSARSPVLVVFLRFIGHVVRDIQLCFAGWWHLANLRVYVFHFPNKVKQCCLCIKTGHHYGLAFRECWPDFSTDKNAM